MSQVSICAQFFHNRQRTLLMPLLVNIICVSAMIKVAVHELSHLLDIMVLKTLAELTMLRGEYRCQISMQIINKFADLTI